MRSWGNWRKDFFSPFYYSLSLEVELLGRLGAPEVQWGLWPSVQSPSTLETSSLLWTPFPFRGNEVLQEIVWVCSPHERKTTIFEKMYQHCNHFKSGIFCRCVSNFWKSVEEKNCNKCNWFLFFNMCLSFAHLLLKYVSLPMTDN